MKILLVDDSITLRKIAQRTLNELGYKKIYEASNGSEGLSILKKLDEIDLIIVDWEMPIMDGLEFIKRARALDKHKNAKIIMATSKNTKESVKEAIKNGADSYIVKPFSDKTLAPKLKAIIDSMKKPQTKEELISAFSNERACDFRINENAIELDFKNKKIKLDLPLLILHGAIQTEETNNEEFVIVENI